MKLINGTCRTFVWTGDVGISKKSLCVPGEICLPLSSRRTKGHASDLLERSCNPETPLWAIAKMKDCLWIRWVHIYYMKNMTVETCAIPRNATWVIRKTFEARKYILQAPTYTSG